MSLIEDFKEECVGESCCNEKGTYVAVKVLNCVELAEHFNKSGLNVIQPNHLHCTILYSEKSFQHVIDESIIEVKPEELEMRLSTLGDNCIVLKLNNQELTKRHLKALEEGGVHGYTTYQAHITLRYDDTDLDLSKLVKPNFPILLGNEYDEPLDLDWKKNIK